MKKTSALLGCLMALAITANAQTTNLIWKDDGSGTPTVSTNFVEDGGLVGIGTTAPSAQLQVNKYISSSADLFVVNSTSLGPPPGLVFTENPLFKITADGFVGIGVATPEVLLQMKVTGFGDPENPMSNPFFIVNDENDETIWAVANSGDATYPAALMVIRSRPNTTGVDFDNVIPAFAIMNTDEQLLNFAVGGDGSVVLGMDVSGGAPFEDEAQLNIHQAVEPLSGLPRHDFLLNVTNASGSTKFLSVRKTGEVGIGLPGTSNTALTLYKQAANTYLDLNAASGYTKAIRFMGASNSQPRHLITEDDGDFVIDPGLSGGGGNDLLKISGNVMAGAGIGTTALPGLSTMAIKGSGFTVFDICETNSVGAIRWLDGSLNPKHQIFDDNNTSVMVIDPGYNNNAPDVLEVRGDLDVQGDLTVNGGWHFNGKVTIGNVTDPNDYMLYVEKGIMTEKAKIAVKTTADWSDFVFDKNYKLPTLQEVEAFIKQNKHLPGVPSADDVVCDGIDVGKMDAKLLQKIEELTLYMLELKKQNEEQQQLIEKLLELTKN